MRAASSCSHWQAWGVHLNGAAVDAANGHMGGIDGGGEAGESRGMRGQAQGPRSSMRGCCSLKLCNLATKLMHESVAGGAGRCDADYVVLLLKRCRFRRVHGPFARNQTLRSSNFPETRAGAVTADSDVLGQVPHVSLHHDIEQRALHHVVDHLQVSACEECELHRGDSVRFRPPRMTERTSSPSTCRVATTLQNK
jgi:hypothetical protein